MNDLRTVTALEHEVIPVVDGDESLSGLEYQPFLTEADAVSLLRLNDIRPGFCQRVSGGVRLAQYCGVVRLHSCVLEVLPKIGISDARATDELARSRAALLTMLYHSRQLRITAIGSVPQTSAAAPLLDIFVEAFLESSLEQARRGLLSRYVPHSDDLPVVKGRFNSQGHTRSNMGRPHLLHCDYDEFTADNAYNRAVRATLDACRKWVSRARTQRLWFEAHARYAFVSLTSVSSSQVARLPRERMTLRYEPLLTWCEWLLSLTSPAMSAGGAHAPGLLFDMNKLFEAYVCGLEEAAAGDLSIVHRQGPIAPLAQSGKDDAFVLRPDITVWRRLADGGEGPIERVVDAKWKRLDSHAAQWNVDEADVYQLLAYAVRYRCKRLELVYPQPGGMAKAVDSPSFSIDTADMLGGSPVMIQVRMVRLW